MYPLYSAIAQRAEFTTLLSADGASQTQARFTLRTKALYLEVKLPEGAELWSAELLGPGGGAAGAVPLKPQREGKSLLVGLPSGAAGGVYDLQLIYAAPVAAVSAVGRGTLRVPALALLLRADRQAAAIELPLADLEWTVRLPGGYEATWAGGTLSTGDVPKPRLAAVNVAGAIYCLAGGVNPFYGLSEARERARRTRCANNMHEIGLAMHNYEATEEPVPSCPPEAARSRRSTWGMPRTGKYTWPTHVHPQRTTPPTRPKAPSANVDVGAAAARVLHISGNVVKGDVPRPQATAAWPRSSQAGLGTSLAASPRSSVAFRHRR